MCLAFGGLAARAAETDPAARGAYLADLGHCMDCHTPNRAEGGGRDWTRLGAGGRVHLCDDAIDRREDRVLHFHRLDRSERLPSAKR